ncbi:hypothetical protein SH449x_004046 [Pirellulaceae bacterium SH449]
MKPSPASATAAAEPQRVESQTSEPQRVTATSRTTQGQRPGANAPAQNHEEQAVRLVQHNEPVMDPQAFAVPREPMAYPMGIMYDHPSHQPMYNQVPPHLLGSNMPYGHVAAPGRPLAHRRPRIHAGGAYQPIFNSAIGSCNTCETELSYPCEPTEFAFAIPREADPQEYIFDGGDRNAKVQVRKDNTYIGLDPEDTVIQYETMDGKVHVDSGCRVAIYAPRFASVRKRYNPVERDFNMQVVNVAQPHGPKMAQNILPTGEERSRTRYVADSQTRIVEAVRQGVKPLPAEGIVTPVIVIEEQDTLSLLNLLATGSTRYRDKADLVKGIAAAKAWSTAEEIGVLADGAEPMSVISSQNTNGVTHYERKGARIRLCKVASEQMAHPGDTIQFIIRFDNVGEQPVSSLVVTDSLTGRLEYIPDTQKSSREAEFILTPNGAGSENLRWELKRDLGPGEGGLISFECLVR